jgi:hypothetical protein
MRVRCAAVSSRPETNAVVRAGRLEIVDERGQVRAALAADRVDGHGDVAVGLEVFDEGGEARAWLVDVGGIAQIALALRGNQVAVLESVVEDDGTATTSLVLCDRSGGPVARWSVRSEGTYSADLDG